jgi:hypothetical protein
VAAEVTAAVEAEVTVVAATVAAAAISAAAISVAVISVVEAMAISAVAATASAGRILAAGTTAVEGSQYPTRFPEGGFTAAILLPDAVVRISARSETPRSHREAPATR